jgi:hypothetical protein
MYNLTIKPIRKRMDSPLKFNSAFPALSPTLTKNTEKMKKKVIKYVRKNFLKDSNQNH